MKNSQSIQYALMCLQALEENSDTPRRAVELSRTCGIPLPDCNRVLQKLSAAGWLEQVEEGKYLLVASVSELTALEIVTAMNTPLKRVPRFKMQVGPRRGPIVRKTLEAVTWAQGMNVYPSEDGALGE